MSADVSLKNIIAGLGLVGLVWSHGAYNAGEHYTGKFITRYFDNTYTQNYTGEEVSFPNDLHAVEISPLDTDSDGEPDAMLFTKYFETDLKDGNKTIESRMLCLDEDSDGTIDSIISFSGKKKLRNRFDHDFFIMDRYWRKVC